MLAILYLKMKIEGANMMEKSELHKSATNNKSLKISHKSLFNGNVIIYDIYQGYDYFEFKNELFRCIYE